MKYFLLFLLAGASLMLSGPVAMADSYSITLTAPNQIAVAGDVVEFDAIIVNLDPSNDLFLNGDNVASLDLPLTLDDTAFWNIPWPLSPAGDPGDSYTGALFDVTVPLGTADGTYAGDFQLLGGSSEDAYDLLGDENFTITVESDQSAILTPEPSSLVLVFTGLAGVAGALRRRKSC
ncbi:MAG: PEP-CTERM sorting domain-containing protein [Terracidiphilus sp.]|jgi:hypothetical protein